MPIKRRTKTSRQPAMPAPILSEEPKQEIHHHYYAKNPYRFDFGKLSFGLFLMILGLLYLAKNMGWVDIVFNFNLGQLWPLLIIFAGLSLLTGRTVASIFAGIVLTLTVITIAFVLILGQTAYRPTIKNGASCTNTWQAPATPPDITQPSAPPTNN